MPIQVHKDKFIQFTYNPDYLRNSPVHKKTVSDVNRICKILNIETIKSSVILDGGNVIKMWDKVLLCDKVIKENPQYAINALSKKLEDIFEVDKIIFIPTDPDDIFGHADGTYAHIVTILY